MAEIRDKNNVKLSMDDFFFFFNLAPTPPKVKRLFMTGMQNHPHELYLFAYCVIHLFGQFCRPTKPDLNIQVV